MLLCLLSLAPRSVQAQGLPAGWTAVPCDATGNTNGTTGFQGTQTGTLTRTGVYKDINDFITANPDYYADGTYENAAAFYVRPTYLNADAGATVQVGAIGVESNSDYGSQEGMQARNFDYDNSNSDGFFTAPGYNDEALSGTLATDVSAGLTVYFKCVWQGGGSQPAYPTSMSLKVTTTVTTTGRVSYGRAGETSGLKATANASDSLGDSASVLVTSPQDASPPPLVTSRIVSVSINGGTGIASYGFSGTAQSTVSNMVPYTDAPGGRGTYTDYSVANANALITAQANPDNRMVTITCPNIEDSYYKATNPDPTHGDRFQHLRDPITGAIVTDSVATWTTADYAAGGGWIASDTFNANTPGFQNPSYTWSGDFSGPGMVGVDLTQKSVNGNWFFGGSDKLPTKSTVRVDVTDSDGASAANTFGITWHLPYEAPNPVPYSVVPGKYQLQPARLGPVSHDQTQLKKPTPAQHFDWEATINGASVVAKVAGQEEIAGGLEIVEAITKIAKPYTDVDADSNTETGATNNSETWSDSMKLYDNDIYGGGNIPADLQGNPDGYLLCDMYIYQVVHYKKKYWYADGYNSHGYDGTSNNVVYLQNIDGVSDEFYYVRQKPSGEMADPIPPTPTQSVSNQPMVAE